MILSLPKNLRRLYVGEYDRDAVCSPLDKMRVDFAAKIGHTAAMADIIMNLVGLKKILPNGVELLRGVSLSFFAGAKIGVIGVNGAGKSTLMRIIAGEDTDYLGEVILAPGTKVGYLPQEPKLDENLDVRGNIELGMAAARTALDAYEACSAKFAEPMSDDEMNRVIEEQARLQDEIEAMNASCMVDLTTDDDLSPKWASLVPDGALVIPPLNRPRTDKLFRDRIPFVVINEKGADDISCVYTDDHQSAHIAIKHLVDMGHTRIAYINQQHLAHGLEYHSSLPDRMNGYVDAMQQYGLEPMPGYDQYMDPRDYFEQIILKHRPTAVLCYKSETMKHLREFAVEAGMRVPEDLSLIGFDLLVPKYHTDFQFTCIDIPMEPMGCEAARILGQKLNNPNHHEQVKVESELIIGQSTAPPAG